MKAFALVLCTFMICAGIFAQKVKPLTEKELQTDSSINAEFITPATSNPVFPPDWSDLREKITTKYNKAAADRAIIRAKIFYYFGKDWKEFNANLVDYTENYEDASDARLMNKNAAMILKYSTDKSELQKAKNWSKLATDKEPTNEKFQQTYKSLSDKLSTQ